MPPKKGGGQKSNNKGSKASKSKRKDNEDDALLEAAMQQQQHNTSTSRTSKSRKSNDNDKNHASSSRASGGGDLSVEELKEKGNAAYAAGNFAEAVKHYNAAIRAIGPIPTVDHQYNGDESSISPELLSRLLVLNVIPEEELKLAVLCRSNCAQAFIKLEEFQKGRDICKEANALITTIKNFGNPDHKTLLLQLEGQKRKLFKRDFRCRIGIGEIEDCLRNANEEQHDEEDLAALEEAVVKVSRRVAQRGVARLPYHMEDEERTNGSWCIAPTTAKEDAAGIIAFYMGTGEKGMDRELTDGLYRVTMPFNYKEKKKQEQQQQGTDDDDDSDSNSSTCSSSYSSEWSSSADDDDDDSDDEENLPKCTFTKVKITPPLPPTGTGHVAYLRDTDTIVVFDNGNFFSETCKLYLIERATGRSRVAVDLAARKRSAGAVTTDHRRNVWCISWTHLEHSGELVGELEVLKFDTAASENTMAKKMILKTNGLKCDASQPGLWINEKTNTLYFFGGDDGETHLNELWALDLSTKQSKKVTPNGLIPAGRMEINPRVLPNGDDVLVGIGGHGEPRPIDDQYFTTGLLYTMSTSKFTILTLPRHIPAMAGVSLVSWTNPTTGGQHLFRCGGYNTSGISFEMFGVSEVTISDPPVAPEGLWEFALRFRGTTKRTPPPKKNEQQKLPAASPPPPKRSDPNDNDALPCPTTLLKPEDYTRTNGRKDGLPTDYWPYGNPSEATPLDPDETEEDVRMRGTKNMPHIMMANSPLHSFGLKDGDQTALFLRSHLFDHPSRFKPTIDVSHIRGGGMNKNGAIKDTLSGGNVPVRPRIHAWGGALMDQHEFSFRRNIFAVQLYGSSQAKKTMRPEWKWVREWCKDRIPRPLPDHQIPTAFVLRIELVKDILERGVFSRAADPIYRVFTCPANMPLNVFSFRVLRPVMGWGLRKHTHCFTDCSTGCVFGNPNTDAIDADRKFLRGGYWLDEKEVRLCDLLRVPGCELEYLYDLGDYWLHLIQLQSIIFRGDTKQGPIVLEGKYNCPPEDSRREYLDAFYNSGRGGRSKANNAKAAAEIARQYAGIDNYNATHFNLDERNAAIEQAFRDPGDDGTGYYKREMVFSARSLADIETDVVDDDAVDVELERCRADHPGMIVTRNDDGTFSIHGAGSYDAKDSVCATCGSAPSTRSTSQQRNNELVTCVRCQRVHYCSLGCALADKARHQAEDQCPGHNWEQAFARRDRLASAAAAAAVPTTTTPPGAEHSSQNLPSASATAPQATTIPPEMKALQEQLEALKREKEELLKEKEEKTSSDDHNCVICFSERRCWVVQPCNHTVLCDHCKDQQDKIKRSGTKKEKKESLLKACPICRGDIDSWMKIYH